MPVKLEMRDAARRTVRYRLYRIQSDAQVDPRDGLKSHFETQEAFDGWHNFARTWDVGDEGEWPEGHFLAVAREVSQDNQWNVVLAEQAVDFGTAEAQTLEVEQHFRDHLERNDEVESDTVDPVITGDDTNFGATQGTPGNASAVVTPSGDDNTDDEDVPPPSADS